MKRKKNNKTILLYEEFLIMNKKYLNRNKPSYTHEDELEPTESDYDNEWHDDEEEIYSKLKDKTFRKHPINIDKWKTY